MSSEKPLVLFNGRMMHPYEHGYVAAYSANDAAKLLEEHCGGSWKTEIRVYWHKGSWGNPMIGVTPERGVFAEKKGSYPRQIVRIEHGNEIPIQRGPEWDEFQAKQKAKDEAVEAKRQREQEERHERANRLADKLESIVGQTIADGPTVTFNFNGHRYEIREVE